MNPILAALPALALCALAGRPAAAQTIAPTTEEEYNYGAIGYKIQLQTRLPMKQGYRMADFGLVEEPGRTVSFKGLLRDGETEPCAVVMVYTRDNTPPEYFCMPTPDAPPALWSRYWQSLEVISDNKIAQLKFMAYGLSRALMRQAARPGTH
jgi:hypothetical protein